MRDYDEHKTRQFYKLLQPTRGGDFRRLSRAEMPQDFLYKRILKRGFNLHPLATAKFWIYGIFWGKSYNIIIQAKRARIQIIISDHTDKKWYKQSGR